MSDIEAIVHCNDDMRLYAIKVEGGFTTLGYDYAENMRMKLLKWVGIDVGTIDMPMKGTRDHFAAYQAAVELARIRSITTGQICPCLLEPRLDGLEGHRVEVRGADGTKRRFWVGRSSGWMPCHIEVSKRGGRGGPQATILQDDVIEVVGADFKSQSKKRWR